MSLINKMLQDLDARRTDGLQPFLPQEVRPLPAERTSRRLVILVALLVLSLLFWSAGAFELSARLTALLAAAPAAESVMPAATREAPAPVEDRPSAPPVEGGGLSGLGQNNASLRLADVLIAGEEKALPGAAAGKTQILAKNTIAAQKNESRRETEKTSVPVRRSEGVSIAGGTTDAAGRSATQAVARPSIERTELGVASSADADYRKALTAVNQGRVDESFDVLRRVLQQEARHVAARQLLVRLLLEARHGDEAVQVLQDGVRELPGQTGWAMSLARLQVERGDLGGAWLTLERSASAAGASAEYQGFAAHVLQRLGRSAEAIERYQLAVRLAPGDGRWALGLGLALEAAGRSGEAREAFLRARQSGRLSAELMSLIDQKLR